MCVCVILFLLIQIAPNYKNTFFYNIYKSQFEKVSQATIIIHVPVFSPLMYSWGWNHFSPFASKEVIPLNHESAIVVGQKRSTIVSFMIVQATTWMKIITWDLKIFSV